MSSLEAVAADADTLVDDRRSGRVAGVSTADPDTALGRAERRGVVEQLGEQVGDVGDDVAAHLQVLEVSDVDPAVVLDLADRGAHDVVDLGGLDATAPATRRWRARADDSLLRRMRVAMWSSW